MLARAWGADLPRRRPVVRSTVISAASAQAPADWVRRDLYNMNRRATSVGSSCGSRQCSTTETRRTRSAPRATPAAELLERRTLLSVAADAGIYDTPQPLDKDVVALRWNGAHALARKGEWIVRVDGVGGASPADKARGLGKLLLARRDDVRVVRPLGGEGGGGVGLVEAPAGVTYQQLHKS